LIRFVAIAFLFFSGASFADEPDSKPYFRHPAVSADGETVAFSYGGDLYTVPSTGGDATLLVGDRSFDSHPSFSPDGRYLAFTSSRSGGGDVYTVDLKSTEIKRLTYHSSADKVEGWGPESKWVYFSAERQRVFYNLDVFKVPVEGGSPVAVVDDILEEEASSTLSPDGREVAYVRTIRQRLWFRRGPFSDVPNEIWIKSSTPETKDYRLFSSMKAKSIWPMWTPDGGGIYFVSDLDQKDGHENLFYKSLSGGEATKLTAFDEGRIFWPDMARREGSVVFEHNFEIWRWSPDAKPKPIDIAVDSPKPDDPASVSTKESGISEFALSPGDKSVAFVLHGEVFLAAMADSVQEERALNISNTAYLESSPGWTSDGGGLVYTSDRNGNSDIFYYDIADKSERQLTDSRQQDQFPAVSPDGKWCAYYRGIREIRLLDLQSGGDSLLAEGFFLKDSAYGYGSLSWSPDSRWIAYVDSDELEFRNVKVVDIDKREPQQISFLSNVTAFYLHWAPDGSFIVFTSGSFTRTRHLFRVDLTKNPSPGVHTKPRKKVEIEGIKNRLHQLNTYVERAYGLGLTADGKSVLTFMAALGGADIFAVPTDPDVRGPLQKLTSAGFGGPTAQGADGKSFWYLNQGKLWNLPYTGGEPTVRLIPAELEIDFHGEKLQVFNEAWQTFFDCWPVKGFNGLDWEEVYDRFLPLARGAQTNEDLSAIINIMMGELNGSHVKNHYSSGSGDPTADLGVAFDQTELEETGRYKIKAVAAGGPLDLEGGGSVVGRYLLRVGETELGRNSNIHSLLNNRAGTELTLTLAESAGGDGAREIAVKPLSGSGAQDLRYSNWVDARRAYVAKAGVGRLGYLHIRYMSLDMLAKLKRDLDSEMFEKDGVVVDLRFNDGGFTGTYMIDMFLRKPSIMQSYRGEKIIPHSLAVGNNFMYRPTIVLQNTATISNGEEFLEMYRHLGLGKTVGLPTTGWDLAITSKNLLNGSSLRLPWNDVESLAGLSLDKGPRYPDITVDNPIGLDWAASDPQADAAIKALLEQIDVKK